ncbi:MAG: aminopeptidase N C-terminal domain-containing protein [Ilumatobacteraceae bacterium]
MTDHRHGQHGLARMNERALEALGPWRIEHVILDVGLPSDPVGDRDAAEPAGRLAVTATSTAVPVGEGPPEALVLDGRGLELRSVSVDGRRLGDDEYSVDERALTIPAAVLAASPGAAGRRWTIEVVTTAPLGGPADPGITCRPGMVSTTLEPQGFRRITYFIDRPSNRATFDVTLAGDPLLYPYLRSNGDRVGSGVHPDGRRWERFADPVPKPSYLFAMVAGDLVTTSRPHTTRSGRSITLTVAAPPDQIAGADFALDVLERAMSFDEAHGAIEHDLDELVFVSVPAYPDATEYHGLMFFESSLLIADPRGVTDDDLLLIAANVAHEYGHHVRGNRVTVRSWGQLTLKEGLTVLMGQNDVRADMLGPAARILDVLDLRRLQFPEELTIGAPPVRGGLSGTGDVADPAALYNRTTYLKGAEVFGMLRTVLGPTRWLDSFNEFVRRFDLAAAGVDDFLDVVRERAGDGVLPGGEPISTAIDGIATWFTVPGRPAISVDIERGDDQDEALVRVRRRDAGAADVSRHVSMPLVISARDAGGRRLSLAADDAPPADEHLVMLHGSERSIMLRGAGARDAVVSALRRFSAPVDLAVDSSNDHLAVLVLHDDDPFTRWWSAEELKIRFVDAHRAGRQSDAESAMSALVGCLAQALDDDAVVGDPLLAAQLLAAPDEFMLGDRDEVIDVDGVASGLAALNARIGAALHDRLLGIAERLRSSPGSTDAAGIARRWLVEPALAPLLASGSDEAFSLAASMTACPDHTVAMRSLAQLLHHDASPADDLIAATFERWRHAPKLVDRWLRAQSGARRSDTIQRVSALAAGPLYDRGDRARVMAVWFPFATRNRSVFHHPSGDGYRIFVDALGPLLAENAGLAVRLVGDLLQFKRFDEHRSGLLRAELERMAGMPGLPDFAVGILGHLLSS